jgi:hypothetical protein
LAQGFQKVRGPWNEVAIVAHPRFSIGTSAVWPSRQIEQTPVEVEDLIHSVSRFAGIAAMAAGLVATLAVFAG